MFSAILRTAPALLFVGLLTACQGNAEQSGATKEASTEAAATANGEPWTEKELLPPADLAAMLTGNAPKLAIFDMGPAGRIKGATEIGPAEEEESLAKLRTALATVPKDQLVVVYCGCCPFEPCPNIRPAFRTLKEQGFTNARLLNMPHNLKADWIDLGYPMAE